MSRIAWIYVWFILAWGALLTGLTVLAPRSPASQWLAFVVFTAAAALTLFFKANTPNRKLYYPNLVFVFAGLLTLQPFFYAMLVIVSYSIEWAKERLTNSPDLRDWYLQPFNIAMIIIAGTSARLVITLLAPNPLQPTGLSSIAAVLLAAVVFVATNQVLLMVALVLARGMSWKEIASVDVENVQADLIHVLLGYVIAIVWNINLWLILPTVAPLFLTYRALMVPQLRKEASTDSKTGLWNARHFTESFTAELERAKRFGHPLTVIMADLDLLRNINNTYGHLAGDAVLAAIGRIVRSTVRDYDIAARFGGEEFTIALPETGLGEAIAIAERLRQAVEAAGYKVRTSETPIHATMSLGVASFPQDGVAANDLVQVADLAVYQAKLRGRNCVVSASDVPRSLKLQHSSIDQPVAADQAVPKPRGEGAEEGATRQTDRPDKVVKRERRNETRANYPDALLALFVGAVILAGLIAAWVGLSQDHLMDWVSVGVLCIMAALTELYQVRLYGDSTFSVSVAITFAAALITGVLGVLSVSLAIVLAHYFRNRRIALFKPAFNWATHVLAGFVPLIAFRVAQISPSPENFFPLTLIAMATGVGYFVIETGLISTAIGLSGKTSISGVWREQFQWTAVYYVVLCVMGLVIVLIYANIHLGVLGLIVVAIPIAVIHYAQGEYVKRTERSVRELNRLNKELSLANSEVLAASQAIRQLNEDLFLTVAKMIDARDPYVLGHALQVAEYASAIGRELDLPADRVERLHQAALLHDIGKIGIPEQILNKPSRLNGWEYEQIKRHAAIGAQVLEASQGLRPLATFVRHHHEWWNGEGYPDRWRGEQIPLEARILAVCDAVDSMASDRPYHRAVELDEIIAEIEKHSGTQFDPSVVEVCKRILKQRGESLVANSALQVAQKSASGSENESHDEWLVLPGALNGGLVLAE